LNPCGRDCLTCTDGKEHLCDECERAFNASKTVQPDGNGEPVWIRLYADETESGWQDAYQKALAKPCEICEEPLAAETYVWFHRLGSVAQCRACRETQWWADGYEMTEQGTPVCWDNRHTREHRIAERERNSLQKLERALCRKMATPAMQEWLTTPDGRAWQQETGWTPDWQANVDRQLRERLERQGISPDVVDTLDHRRNEHPEPDYVEV